VHAKKNPEGGEGRRAGRYVPKTVDTDSVTVRLPDGREVIAHLSAYDGALSLKQLTETGEPHYEPLAVTRLQRNPNKHGFRWYGVLQPARVVRREGDLGSPSSERR
jgi:small nuclear ribonucleoprotein (snRNP)-like protein